MNIPDEVIEVYNLWNPNDGGFQGACSECPVRDERGCRSPFYGHGTFNQDGEVDIMLIGESPGTAGQEDGANPPKSEIRELTEKQTGKISAAFGKNSKHLQPFTNELQKEYDVYFTNLLKCNKLAIPGDGDSWMPTKIIDEQPDPTTNHRVLNDRAKKICNDYLIDEIFRLNPDVIVPFGGNAMVEEVYDLFGMSVPKLKDAINSRETYNIELSSQDHSDTYSGILVPSYHFSENRFKSRVTNITGVSGKSITEVRDQYWTIITQMLKQEIS